MGTKTYDSNEVSVIFGAFKIDSGREDGDFVKITPASETYTSKAGSDGEVTRSKSNDARARVDITVMQTSGGNNIIQTIFAADKLAASGSGVLPILIKDNNGLSLYAGEHAWVMNDPEVNFGKEAGTRTWPLEVANLKSLTLGSTDI